MGLNTEELRILTVLSLIGGSFIFKVGIAWIRRNDPKLIKLIQNSKGNKELTIQGYSHKEIASVVISRSVPDGLVSRRFSCETQSIFHFRLTPEN